LKTHLHNLFRLTGLAQFWICLAIVAVFLILTTSIGLAQDQPPDGPVYIVQEGDSLWDVAARFGLTLEELTQANGISDPNQLALGARLVIPGFEGVSGVLTTESVGFGETLESLSRRYQTPASTLARLNQVTSPAEIYAGIDLIVPVPENQVDTGQRASLAVGQSLLELAVLQNSNPWSIVAKNGLTGTVEALPGDVMRTTGEDDGGPGALPESIRSIQLKPSTLMQGKAAVIQVQGSAGLTLSGSFLDHELNFFPVDGESYVSLQGVHAMLEPGLYPLTLKGSLPDETPIGFTQLVFVRDGGYPYDPPLTVPPETIDPAVTKPEDAQWSALAAPVTGEKYWQDVFHSPTPPEYSDCFTSWFGDRRSYNGSPYDYFHSGLDFCTGSGPNILAAAAGKVIFAGPLTVRGNATMIDHGWGVYTAYMHQSELFVQAGDMVQAGQVIGASGGTGRAQGPHLHFEVLVGGVQVDPEDWLAAAFP
jgi:murein DD-endopeptidase MepM/ murein hydrolase activator NlpD